MNFTIMSESKTNGSNDHSLSIGDFQQKKWNLFEQIFSSLSTENIEPLEHRSLQEPRETLSYISYHEIKLPDKSRRY